MLGFVKNLLGISQKQYENQKNLLTGSDEDRKKLASDSGTHPEVLFYLAKDANADVRKSAAMNKSMPVQASTLLANDKSEDVRLALAARLVELLPNLSMEKHSQLYAYAVQALGVLAKDEVVKVRKALSTALQDHAKAPPKVVGQLARDVEREVAEPILRFCITLSDEDLLEILGNHPDAWVISAIARRAIVSERVSNAVIETKDLPASKELIQNKGAKFAQETLEKIIELSRDHSDWHEPLAVRKELSMDFIHRMAGFVGDSVLKVLEERSDFDAATRRDVSDMVKRRIEFHRNDGQPETPEAKLERYVKSGKLNGGVIQDALAWNDHKFVLLGLAHCSEVHPVIVEKMLRSGSAKPIIALCWKAKMPMRLAVELQRSYARLQPSEFMYAKGGTDYPMTAPEIKWQLDFYGIDVAKKQNP